MRGYCVLLCNFYFLSFISLKMFLILTLAVLHLLINKALSQKRASKGATVLSISIHNASRWHNVFRCILGSKYSGIGTSLQFI